MKEKELISFTAAEQTQQHGYPTRGWLVAVDRTNLTLSPRMTG